MFRSLHEREGMFVLPNAWSVGSAYIFEKEGFEAVATSSAGIAYDSACPDGEDIRFGDLLYLVGKMAARLGIPLSVDFERGWRFRAIRWKQPLSGAMLSEKRGRIVFLFRARWTGIRLKIWLTESARLSISF